MPIDLSNCMQERRNILCKCQECQEEMERQGWQE